MSHSTAQRRAGMKSGLLATLLAALAACAVFPLLDQQAGVTYEKLFQRALVTFALARTLNGVISAVQGTEIAIQPAGMGVTLTPGELLDPVNDLVERFSWIMLGATVSLGIQQVLMEVSAWWLLKGLVAVMAGWLIVLVFSPDRPPYTQMLVRVFCLVLFLRFAVPLSLVANEALYDLFLEDRYQESSQVVTSAGEEIRQIGEDVEETNESERGLLESLGDAISHSRQALDLGGRVERIRVRAAEMVEHLIQLAVVFILQTGVLPIVFLWLFLKLAAFVIRSRSLGKRMWDFRS